MNQWGRKMVRLTLHSESSFWSYDDKIIITIFMVSNKDWPYLPIEVYEESLLLLPVTAHSIKLDSLNIPWNWNSYQGYLPPYYKENRLNLCMHFLYIAFSYPFVLRRWAGADDHSNNHVSYCSSVAAAREGGAYKTFPTKEQFHTADLSNMPNQKILARLLFSSRITISW